jgi:hypothetical protein
MAGQIADMENEAVASVRRVDLAEAVDRRREVGRVGAAFDQVRLADAGRRVELAKNGVRDDVGQLRVLATVEDRLVLRTVGVAR